MIQLLLKKPRFIFSFYLCLRLISPNYAFMRRRLYSKRKVKEYKAFTEMYVKLYVKLISINETLHMLKKNKKNNIPAISLKILCKNLYLVKCYGKTKMKLFALSLWKISAEPFSLFHHGLLI